MKYRLLLLLTLLMSPLHAQLGSDPLFGDSVDNAQAAAPTSTSEIIGETTAIKPGQSFRVAIKLGHPPHFHSYYHNDGIGISIIPTVKWQLPEGFSASPLVYPAPKEFQFTGMNAYGYEGDNYFLTTVTAPASLKSGSSVTLTANADWQICDDKSCQPPESAKLELILPVSDTVAVNPKFAAIQQFIDQRIPSSLPADWIVTASESKGDIILNITGDLPADALFYEFDGQIDAQQPRGHTADDKQHTFIGKRNKGNAIAEAKPTRDTLRGILFTPTRSYWIELPLGSQAATTAPTTTDLQPATVTEKPVLSQLIVFPLLLLGGFVLNLMPCVFPVIGLKIMGFVQQAGEDKKKIKLHGLAFTVGVLLSFLALATILYPIKGNSNLGSQLQEPWVVFILLLVMLLLGLSMSGLFEIGTKATSVGGKLTQKDGVSGSFFSGILAVVIATPCSAPFLGPAIGAAWKYDGPLFFAALLTMGLGLSLPYIVLAFMPSLVNKLPRPGAWMESFKQGMAFLLYATAGYLLWVYNTQVGEEGQKGLAIVLGLTTIALAAWVYGRWDQPIKKLATRRTAKILTLVFFATGFILAMPPQQDPLALDEESAAADPNAVPPFEWQTWSPQKVEQLLAKGTPVYVDFTAKWCLTCQTNKAAAYTDDVRKLFYEKGIVVLKADMTKKHPVASKAIQELDRSAIPVNVLYVPGDNTPHVTRELLSAGYLTDFINDFIPESK